MPGGTPRTPALCQRRRIGVMGWCCEDGPFPRRAPGRRCRLTIALYLCRGASRRSWRQAMLLALLSGLLGAVALGAIAGAHRTSTAYGRYPTASNASDVFVNVAGKLPIGIAPRWSSGRFRTRGRHAPGAAPAWPRTGNCGLYQLPLGRRLRREAGDARRPGALAARWRPGALGGSAGQAWTWRPAPGAVRWCRANLRSSADDPAEVDRATTVAMLAVGCCDAGREASGADPHRQALGPPEARVTPLPSRLRSAPCGSRRGRSSPPPPSLLTAVPARPEWLPS